MGGQSSYMASDYPGTAIGDGITHKEGMEEPVYYWDP